MRIEIDICVANDNEAHNWLDSILRKIDDGWHVWDTTSQPDPCDFETTTWMYSRGLKGQWVRELLVASIQRGAWGFAPHGRYVRVTGRPSTTDELSPEDAARLAEQPLCILVENRFSDGAFVRRVLQEFNKPLFYLLKKPEGPIRFDSLGGKGEMIKEVRRREEKVKYRSRLVAIIDSDRMGPGAPESRDAQELRKECAELNVPCWVLAKREAENYLPRILLSEWGSSKAGHNQLVEAWDRLNDDQKDFFDMKYGFRKELSGITANLFQGLSPPDRETLATGFGKKVHECWTCSDVPVMVELLNRSQGDLEHGMALICKEV